MNKVVIYSKDDCVYCDRSIASAKQLNVAYGVKLVVLKLREDYSLEEFRMIFPNATTFPQIVVDGEKAGGWQEFTDLVMNTEF